MDKQGMLPKSRKFGSSHWKKEKCKWGRMQMCPILEEELFSPEIMKKVQDIVQECKDNEMGFITRGDMQKLKEEGLPWSTEELELLFDGLDSDSQGYLTAQEFIAGLRHLLSSQAVTQWHRKRKDALLKGPASPSLEEAETEQQKCFETFICQLEADSFLEERVADHNKEVQQLYEEMEQQMEREKKSLQQESEIRSKSYSVEMEKTLEVKEREIQHFLCVQKELEAEMFSLQEKQHKAGTKNQHLKQNNIALENQLQQALRQLQETHRHLDAMKNRVSRILKAGSRAPENNASITKDVSEPRTRVISIEAEPLPEFTEEDQQHFIKKTSGQSSLFREIVDAIAALNKVSESHQQMYDLGFQGQESSDQMKQGGNNQHYTTQEKMPQYEALLMNDGPGKRILETDQSTLKQDILFKGQSYVQGDVPEMESTSIFEPRVDLQALEPIQRKILSPKVCFLSHSELASQVSDSKRSPEQDILSLGQITQPRIHGQVLKMRERIQAQWPSVNSEQGMVKKKSMEIKTDKEMPSSVESILPKLHVECRPEISLVHNSQLENMSQSETSIQTSEEKENPLADDRKEGQGDMSECEKNQEAGTEINKETNIKTKGITVVCPYPEHLYNVLFVGDSNVGKTSFLCRLHDDSFGSNITSTIGMDYRIKNIFVDNKCFALRLWDTAGQERYHSVTKQLFRKADGVVLMYDITSENSFADVRYWLSCIQEGAEDGTVVLLLGNKTDCTALRRVSAEDGSHLAQEYGLSFYECSAASGHNVLESMVKFVRLLKTHEDQLKQKILELPAQPTKKRGCCS